MNFSIFDLFRISKYCSQILNYFQSQNTQRNKSHASDGSNITQNDDLAIYRSDDGSQDHFAEALNPSAAKGGKLSAKEISRGLGLDGEE